MKNTTMDLFTRDNVVGVFRGFREGGLEFQADLVLPYRNEFQSIPMHGQFLLVQLETPTEAVLGRIASFSSEGKLSFGSGEEFNIRALRENRDVPEDLREQYLKYKVMRTYAPDQWLRLWFLGGPTRPNYAEVDQLTHASPEAFAKDLRRVWKNLAYRSSDDCRLVVRFGAINDRKLDPVELLRNSLRDTGWRITTVHAAGQPPRGRRQAEHFGTTSDLLDEFDIWAIRS